MNRRTLVCGAILTALLTVSPPPSFGANKDILELQRQLAQLEDVVKALQKSQEDRAIKMEAMVQQAINAGGDAGRSAAIIQNNLQSSLTDMQSKVAAPVIGLGKRMDDMSNDMRTLQQAVADLASSVSKMQALLNDINIQVKAIQGPIQPPPPGSGGPGPVGSSADPGATAPSTGEKPPISQSDLMANANRDRGSGKLDLAVQEYGDYLKWFGKSDMAPVAQYYIGWIRYSQGDYENAVKELDVVLERFPENTRTPDAMYYKGLSLMRLQRKNDASKEFINLAKKYPRNDLAPKACEQLKYLGMNCPIARAAAPPKGAARRNNKK
jgi:TolA-binding protein